MTFIKYQNIRMIIVGKEAYIDHINLKMEVTTKKAFHRQLYSKPQT